MPDIYSPALLAALLAVGVSLVAGHPVVLVIVTGLVLAWLLVPGSDRGQIAEGDR